MNQSESAIIWVGVGIGGGIVLILLVWFITDIAKKANDKHIDNKNAKIKAAGGNKKKLSDRYESK